MRIVGIRHRRKKTVEGEARPTQVAILEQDAKKPKLHDITDETSELDWVMARFPVSFRKVNPDENISRFPPHQIKWRRLKKGEKSDSFPKNLLRKEKNGWFLAEKVPDKFEGLQKDDTVCMILGGSGDRFASALSRRGETIGAKVLRIPAFRLDAKRDKDQDAPMLTELARDKPDTFYETGPRDREIIWVVECWRAREEAMKARIACEQRLLQTLIGRMFCNKDGQFPEGSIELIFEQEKTNNAILANLSAEEKAREQALIAALETLDIYSQLFGPIKGIGPMIAARLIVAIQDIRRFGTEGKLKAFCGAHVLRDGRFARHRHNEVANWHPDARQALFLLGDQFNRRPDTPWGQKLLEYKVRFRQKHPVVEINPESGKKRYTDGHIHKMAFWRTLTKFVEWLYKEWWRIERQRQAV